MLGIPHDWKRFEERLRKKAIPGSARGFYKKMAALLSGTFAINTAFGLHRGRTCLAFFKIEGERKTESRREQAAKAIELFFQIIREKTSARNSRQRSEKSNRSDSSIHTPGTAGTDQV